MHRGWFREHQSCDVLLRSQFGTRLPPMTVIAVSTLKAFWNDHPEYRDAKAPTLAWYRDVLKAEWSKPSDVKLQFGTASILQDGRVVFNVGGNKFRIVVW